jgi:transcription initiation factor TFIIIB Brf1 subunit/transcription initiation factor TFIIB
VNGVGKMCITKEAPKTHRRLADKFAEYGSKNLVHDYDTDETICGTCGLVSYEQMLDKGSELRAFNQQENAPLHTRAKTTFVVIRISCRIFCSIGHQHLALLHNRSKHSSLQ